MSQIFNGYWNGGIFTAWSTETSRVTVFLWLGFAIARTTLHVALQGNLVTVKGAPYDDGSFHTLAFTERILGRIRETWS